MRRSWGDRRDGDAGWMSGTDVCRRRTDRFADRIAVFGAVLFERSVQCEHRRFCAPGTGFLECVLRTVPCSVLQTNNPQRQAQASFGGINPAVGSNVMFFPAGRSKYTGIHLAYAGASGLNPLRRVRRFDVALAYTLSRYRTNIAEPNGSGGDYSRMNVAEDYNRPHLGYWGASGMDRTHQFTFMPTAELSYGVKVSMIAHVASPLPLSAYIPQQDGGGVAGEIFRSDITGDGTVGDLLPNTFLGNTGNTRIAI